MILDASSAILAHGVVPDFYLVGRSIISSVKEILEMS